MSGANPSKASPSVITVNTNIIMIKSAVNDAYAQFFKLSVKSFERMPRVIKNAKIIIIDISARKKVDVLSKTTQTIIPDVIKIPKIIIKIM